MTASKCSFPFLLAVLAATGAVADVKGLPNPGAVEEKVLSPDTILKTRFEGKATVEFRAGEVTTLNIDSIFVPGVSHTQIIKAQVPGAKDGEEFLVIVSRGVATRLLQLGIEDPAKHFRGKVLRVSGAVERQSEAQYKIRVTSLDQLESIRKP